MRLLIGSDTDYELMPKEDVRSWTQRILWFAQDGDAVILLSQPDRTFLREVAQVTGVRIKSLKFFVMPVHPSGKFVFGGSQLVEPGFVKAVCKSFGNISKVISLWPSQHVAHFLERIGLTQLWPGCSFFAQGGGEMCNSKACFRAFAAQSGVPIARGGVCHSMREAIALTESLLESSTAVMVKMAFGGGGGGNQLLSRDRKVTAEFAGAAFQRFIADSRQVAEYWRDHWRWASVGHSQPVVIEAFIPHCESIYAEFECTEHGVGIPQVGVLKYAGGMLIGEIMPYNELPDRARDILVAHATTLAEYYQRLGYRGYLSADALVNAEQQIIFTEVNAQFTGSTHLYSVIGKVNEKQSPVSRHSVIQFEYPKPVAGLSAFVEAVAGRGLGFNAKCGEGVFPAWPVVPHNGRAHLRACALAQSPKRREELVLEMIREPATPKRSASRRSSPRARS